MRVPIKEREASVDSAEAIHYKANDHPDT